jgi:hypothetical protein
MEYAKGKAFIQAENCHDAALNLQAAGCSHC